jgi:hypothetical protein
MKRALPLVLLLLIPALAEAQTENHTIPVSAANQVRQALVISKANRATCARFNLSFPCTQGAVCAAAGTPGGSGCTAAQARAAEVRVWSTATLADREEFTIFGIAQPAFQELLAAATQEQVVAGCVNWAAMNTTQRNAVCSAYTPALPAGCNPGGCP